MLAERAFDWANIIRDQRRALRLSQAELANRIGMSRQWVVNFETGRNTATAALDTVLAMLDILDLGADVRRVE